MAGLLDSRSEMFESCSTPNEAHPLDAMDATARIDDDQRAAAATKKKFMKLRAVCIGAQQVRGVLSGVLLSCFSSCDSALFRAPDNKKRALSKRQVP